MSMQPKNDEKVQKASTFYDEPQEVLVDASMSKVQKGKALDTLEQDARQLAEAATEGMGGEEPDKLQDVLIAKDTLALTPAGKAFDFSKSDLKIQCSAPMSTQRQNPPTGISHSAVTTAAGVHSGQSEHDIRVVAHRNWERAGKPIGDDCRFWLEAEQELSKPSEAAGRH